MESLTHDALRLKSAAWLLALSPLAFVALIVSAVLVLVPNKIGRFDTITPEQMAAIRIGWIINQFLLGMAITMGVAGLALLNRGLRPAATRLLSLLVTLAAALSVLCIVGYVVLRVSMVGFSEDRLGLAPGYTFSNSLVLVALWCAQGATALTSLVLAKSGIMRRTAQVVGGLSLLLLVADILSRGAVPPFAVSLMWLALGVGLLRWRGDHVPRVYTPTHTPSEP